MCEIHPAEVLAYLNELGYTNIEGHQLKAFIVDLKKLIKFESSLHQVDETDNLNLGPVSNIFQTLHSTGTVASKAKEKKESLITVQVARTRSNSDNQVPTNTRTTLSDITNGSSTKSQVMSKESTSNEPRTCSSSCVGTVQPKRSKLSQKQHVERPRSSVIRVRSVPLKPCRSDPVALYHYYQKEWKNSKIPGQDSHSDLRWAIREKLLGEDPTKGKCRFNS